MSSKRFLFTCGGTAGHINPALAVAGKLREIYPDGEFLFIGSGRAMERNLIPREGFELRNITITGFSRSLSMSGLKKNAATLRNVFIARKESEEIIREFKPDVVIGTGGYVCFPVINAAAKQKIPAVMHESNAVPGLTTKLVSGVVDRVFVAFPGTEQRYRKPERVTLTGTPVRGDFTGLTREKAREKLGITDGRPLVVSFWGSLGADGMNEKMADFIAKNDVRCPFHHIHGTGGGEAGLTRMNERLRKRGTVELADGVELRPYIDNMGEVMTAADLVLCRAGASTLAEIMKLGRASILVPSPNVTNDHQTKNARELEQAGAAVLMAEADCTGEKLYDAVAGLLADRERLNRMETASASLGISDATERIVNEILDLINR